MKNRNRIPFALAILLIFVMGCGTLGGVPTEAPAQTGEYPSAETADPVIQVRLSGSMKQLEQIMLESGVPMEIQYMGDVELRVKIQEYDAASVAAKKSDTKFHSDIDVFGTAGDMWMPGSYIKSRTRLPSTYTLMLANKKFAEKMGWQINSLLSLSELDAAVESGARIGMTSASQDGAGTLTMLAHLQAQKGSEGEPLQVADLDNPSITGKTDAFYDAVVDNVSNVDLLVKRAVQDRLDGDPKTDLLFLPESAAIALDAQLKANGSEQMLAFYVDGLTSIQTLVIGCSSDIADANAQQCAKLIAHLNSAEAQAKMLAMGYRVTAVGMRIENPNPAVFDPSLGFMADREFVAANPPKEDVIKVAQDKYQSEFRPESVTAMCADHTGSMDGDGIVQLRLAMRVVMIQDDQNALKYTLQATDGDLLFVMPFAESVQATYRVEGKDPVVYQDAYNKLLTHYPDDGTDIYNCAIEALKTILANNQDNSRLPAVILLTDGEQSSGGATFNQLKSYVEDNHLDIPIYSIVLGKAVMSDLEAIAALTNGDTCDGRGGEEAVVRCFLQFKGNN